jgi:hypothetical protein
LLREKAELDNLKSEREMNHRRDLQRKEQEKEQIRAKQELIESRYLEEARKKLELENELNELKALREQQLGGDLRRDQHLGQKLPPRRLSPSAPSDYGPVATPVTPGTPASSPPAFPPNPFSPQPSTIPIFTPSVYSPAQSQFQYQEELPKFPVSSPLQQKINPSYLIEK